MCVIMGKKKSSHYLKGNLKSMPPKLITLKNRSTKKTVIYIKTNNKMCVTMKITHLSILKSCDSVVLVKKTLLDFRCFDFKIQQQS